MTDDDLELFEANGAPPLPPTAEHGSTDHEGATIWYASFGAGSPVILLHGGLGHSGNWGIRCRVWLRRDIGSSSSTVADTAAARGTRVHSPMS